MTRYDPSLKINRLVVVKQDMVVYDEVFHEGVNIIRGTENSVGKSTIADMIFYALGGEDVKWVEEAKACSDVIAEVTINGVVLTLKREISEQKERGMSIYWGDLASASAAGIVGWQSFPFSQKGNSQSFSQVLFRAIEIPEVKGELASRLTMNQLLRLIYADQKSSTNKMFREEEFSRKDTLEAIGNLLCGVYDDRIYQIGIDLQEKQSEIDNIKGQLKAIWQLLGGTDQSAGLEMLKQQLHETKLLLSEEYKNANVKQLEPSANEYAVEQEKRVTAISNELATIKERIHSLEMELQSVDFEIEDSQEFIEALEKNDRALQDSIKIHSILGEIPFQICPVCFAKITMDVPENTCALCKSASLDRRKDAHLLRLKQELVLQLNESKQLQEKRMTRRDEVRKILPILYSQADLLSLQYNDMSTNVKPQMVTAVSEMYRKIGYLTRKTEDLEKQIILAQSIDELENRRSALTGEVDKLQSERERRRETQRKNADEAYGEIQAIIAELLKKDLPVEDAFQNPETVAFSFREDAVLVNSRNNYSASSKVILKNSFHLALLLASTQKPFFRYPRFSLFDNIEDKGMKDDRSHNFQKLIIEMSKKAEVEHQIIFTTSMIADELNTPEFTIGEFYTPKKKSLKIKSA